jgi:hypothetical protein
MEDLPVAEALAAATRLISIVPEHSLAV